MKYGLQAMRRNGGTAVAGGGGAIVNLASGCSSFIAQPAFVPYSTTKGEVSLHQIGSACYLSGCYIVDLVHMWAV